MRQILLILIILSSISYSLATETKLPDAQWQSSMGGSKQMLSVRHKMIGVSRNYKAEFIVYHKDTKETYYSNILVKKAEWGNVLFPDDFRKKDGSKIFSTLRGNFIWNCIVEGDMVLDGTFSFKSSLFDKNDIRKLN